MTKVDTVLDVVNDVAADMAERNARIEYAHLVQEMRRGVEREIARARANEASYEAPTP